MKAPQQANWLLNWTRNEVRDQLNLPDRLRNQYWYALGGQRIQDETWNRCLSQIIDQVAYDFPRRY